MPEADNCRACGAGADVLMVRIRRRPYWYVLCRNPSCGNRGDCKEHKEDAIAEWNRTGGYMVAEMMGGSIK